MRPRARLPVIAGNPAEHPELWLPQERVAKLPAGAPA